MKFDFDKVVDRHGTKCLKYDFAKERGRSDDMLPLWVADMDFPTAPGIQEKLSEAVAHGIYGYSEGKDDYFQAAARWYEKHFGWKVEKEWLIKTPGVVFALAMAVKAYTEEGDAVLLQQMVEAGMTGIRMNLSHGPLAAHKDWLALLRKAGVKKLLVDLQGPELRIGTLAEPVALVEGSSVRLGADGVPCPAALVQAAAPGQQLLLDDGKLLVQVTQALPEALVCTVVRGGTLQSRKSIAAPGLAVPSPTLTEEDLQNLKIAKQCGVTGVMLPFVRGKADILALRHALEEAGAADIRIFAKIENMTGVRALPEFIHLVDEVVIARGDLGNAMPLWELPRCQKQLSAACRAAGVPFMVVTQMLDSMCTRAVPTRAEVSDIYNAVLDGAASVMLTGETAAGQYPMQAMEYLVRTAQTALA